MGATDSLPPPPAKTEVLIVGAGPAGLMLALLLARKSVPLRIVDARLGPCPDNESRAFVLQARTLELLRSLGFVAEVLTHAVCVERLDFFVRGAKVGDLDLARGSQPDTDYNCVANLPQNVLERVLLDHLGRAGVVVERGTRVTSIVESRDGVRVEASKQGKEVEIEARFLAGCDGSKSFVRQSIGTKQQGDIYAGRYMLADCRVAWPLDHDSIKVFMDGKHTGVFVPLQGTRLFRILISTTPHELQPAASASLGRRDSPQLKMPTLAEVEELFTRCATQPVTLSNATWLSHFTFAHMCPESFASKSRRIFLVGDAAHVHSPAGGQGLNTGVQDAANLAWKLEVAHRGGVSALGLLETYDLERRPVGEEVVATTDAIFSHVAGVTGLSSWFRDMSLRLWPVALGSSGSFHRRWFRKLSQLDVAYTPSGYLAVSTPFDQGGPMPGERAPNVPVGESGDMHGLLAGYTWSVVAFSRATLSEKKVKSAFQTLGTLTPPSGLRKILLSSAPTDRTSLTVFDWYGVVDKRLYVVRPDGYIGWTSAGWDWDECNSYLARFSSWCNFNSKTSG